MYTYLKCIKLKTVYCFATVSVIFVIFYLNNTSYVEKAETELPRAIERPVTEITADLVIPSDNVRPMSETKYILLWTNPNSFPFVYFGEGNSIFKKKKCKYFNCYVTSNRTLLRDYTEYDIVVFNGPQLRSMLDNDDEPILRSFRQKYVYANIEAAVNYPICRDTWDNFFNWTWTYKLNSDAIWGYISITNSSNHIIGPRMNMDWMSVDDMTPISKELKLKLASKNKAAAWFVSNCNTLSRREVFVNELQAYLADYNLKVDVYGSCGNFQCPKSLMNRCLEELEKNYYFYFAFENAVSEDYVTEKILHALNYHTVPIVFGGADYSRYLPPDSYLDAYKLGTQRLAKEMNAIIENREIYYRFFRWRKYYKIRRSFESPATDEYCRFCEMANDENLMNNITTYEKFSSWWTPAEICANKQVW